MHDMTPNEAHTYAHAVDKLEDWRITVASRDTVIREAHEAGVPKAEIARRMKISRDTVIRVLGSDDEEG